MCYINEIMTYRVLQMDCYSHGSSGVLRPDAFSFKSQNCFVLKSRWLNPCCKTKIFLISFV